MVKEKQIRRAGSRSDELSFAFTSETPPSVHQRGKGKGQEEEEEREQWNATEEAVPNALTRSFKRDVSSGTAVPVVTGNTTGSEGTFKHLEPTSIVKFVAPMYI